MSEKIMSSGKEKSFLNYEVTGAPAFAVVRITLDNPGQKVRAEGGSMVYMDGHVNMETKSAGGVMRGLKGSFQVNQCSRTFFRFLMVLHREW